MAKQGMLAGNSYEVLTKNGTRWTIDAAFKKKYDALTRAGELLSTNEYECVRVLEERKGDDEEYIIFEETAQLKQKPIKIVPVKEAPVCQNFPDYYKYSARKTIGRLIRGYLDQHGMIALQLYYDTGYLAYLERMDTYYNGAIRHVGSLQAKILDEKPNDRADAIYKAFARIREQARDRDDVIPYNGGDSPVGLRFVPVEQSAALWAGVNDCDASTSQALDNGGLILSFEGCADNHRVLHYGLADQGHDAGMSEEFALIASEFFSSVG